MRTVWDISNNKEKSELAYGKHPTQKPIRILKRMIQLTSREGDVMLTPFSGAGSECVAAKMTGRKYGLFEEYKLDDAEVAIVVINSTAGTAKTAIDEMRKEGKKVGLLKIRVFRPFPMEEIAEALKHVKMVAVMDKSEGFSAAGGPVFAEVRSALYDCNPRPKMVNYVYGLGGRDVTVAHIREIFETLLREKDGEVKDTYRHFGVRG